MIYFIRMEDILGVPKKEILIIGLIVGVLGVVALLAIQTARSSMRDAVRLSDVRQSQLSLELYFNDVNSYPETEEVMPLGTVSSSCLTHSGFKANCSSEQEKVYAQYIAGTPTKGLKKKSSCGGIVNAYCYASDGEDYRIQFELESVNRALGVQKGVNCLTPSGFSAGECESLPTL